MQRMQIFDLLTPGTKTLQNTEQITQITWVEKSNKKPNKFGNPDLARLGEKNHRIIKLSHLALRTHPVF